MAAGLTDVLRWNPDGIETVASAVRADATTIEDHGEMLRTDAERTFEWMSGETIDAARASTGAAVRRSLTLNDQLSGAADILSNFAKSADVPQQRLRDEVTLVRDSGVTVTEDGSITPPPRADSTAIDDLKTSADIISSNLESLRTLDSEAAAALKVLSGTVADYSDNADPTTMLVGMIHTTMADAISDGIDTLGDNSDLATKASRAMGPFGNLLAFATGVAGAPEDEPIHETLIAESAGLVAGAGGAAIGATLGSFVPVVGTAVGAGLGFLLAAGGSYLASAETREYFDDRREHSFN